MLLPTVRPRRNRQARRAPRPRPLEMETLEDRTLLSLFGPPFTFSAGDSPASLAVGDFNNDGKLDLVTANESSDSVSVLLGKGDGSIQARRDFAVGFEPVSVAVGDFNGDGKLDLVVANQGSNNISILLGNGDGTFRSAQNLAVSNSATSVPTCVAVADFNHDGRLDLVVTFGNDTSKILLGNGDGTFQPASNLPDEGFGSAATVADLNHDGNPDILIANWVIESHPSIEVLLGNSDGTFRLAGDYPGGGTGTIAVGDFNGDGKLDLVQPLTSNQVQVFLGNGDGSFQSPVYYTTGNVPSSVTVGDFNRDGKLDIVTANSDNTLSVLLGNGDGTFQAHRDYVAATEPTSVAVGDFNGDGLPDLALTNSSSNSASVQLNQDADRFLVTPSGSSVVAGASFTVTITALDYANVFSPDYTGTVYFTSSDSQAVLPADYTFTAADFGKHSFPVTLKTVGNQSLTVTDQTNHSVTGAATNLVQLAVPPTASFDWSMPKHFGQDNLTTHFDPATGKTTLTPGPDGLIDYPWEDPTYAQDYINPKSWTVNFDASTSSQGTSSITSYTWTIQGVAQPSQSSPLFSYAFPQLGTYSVKLTVTAADGSTTSTLPQDVVVQDLFIVSLGDSFASGEGNPDIPQQYNVLGFVTQGPVWEDERAHRSEFAGPAQAALQIQAADPHRSVTFISLAASGAEIINGLIGPYTGRETPTGNDASLLLLPPQVDELFRLAKGRTIDQLIISIGGNDVGFGPLFAKAIESLDKGSPAGSDIDNEFRNGVAALPDLYDQLDRRLHGARSQWSEWSTAPAIRNVSITEYPDLVRTADGGYSSFTPLGDVFMGLSGDQTQWASTVAEPLLLNAIRAAAVKEGWNYISGVYSAFATHGYGAGDLRWVNTATDAVLAQGSITPSTDTHLNLFGFPTGLELRVPWEPSEPNIYYKTPLNKFEFEAGEVKLILAGLFPSPFAPVALLLAFDDIVAMKDTAGMLHPNREGQLQGYAAAIVNGLNSGLIQGRVFEDATADGISRPEEQGLSGWTVYLDANNNGQLDPGEISTLTDTDGRYGFFGLAPGTYLVREMPQPENGWLPTRLSATASVSPLLYMPEGTVANFGNYKPGSILGRVVNDADRDGIPNPGEPGLGGWTVYLDLNNNDAIETRQVTFRSTDAPKNIKDATLIKMGRDDPGEETPSTTVSGGLKVSDLTGLLTNVTLTLTIMQNVQPDLDVVLISPWGQRVTVFGSVSTVNRSVSSADFNNQDPNGNWYLEITDNKHGFGSARLQSWSLTLTAGDPSTQTSADGRFSFDNLRPGYYVLRERILDGWARTDGVGDSQTALVRTGQADPHIFLNSQLNTVTIGAGGSGPPVTVTSPVGTQVIEAGAVPNPSPGNVPAGVSFPLGLFDFVVLGVAPKGATTVQLTLPPNVTVNTYYKYGPTPDNAAPHWYEFLFDGRTGAEINGQVITLHFVDGQRGDDDLTSEGIIVGPGAPGRIARVRKEIIGRVSETGDWWVGTSNGSNAFTNSLFDRWSSAVTWVDVQTGDFNGDGKTDIVGRVLETGQWWVGLSTGSSFETHLWTTWSPNVTWADVQVGDFTGDGRDDLVGRVAQTGQIWVATSTGSSFTNSLWATWSTMATWVDVRVGDFNGDGKADITGRWLQGGSWWTGLSTGSNLTTSMWAAWSTAVTWVDVQVGDFNGDGKSDIAGRVLETGQWWTGLSTGTSFNTTLWTTWSTGVRWVDVKVGDFNGDGTDDIIGRASEIGQWWAGVSTGSTFSNSLWSTWSTGVNWVDVQVGDYNGDGKADITGRDLGSGAWWTGLSNGSTGFNTTLWTIWNPGVTWVDVQHTPRMSVMQAQSPPEIPLENSSAQPAEHPVDGLLREP